MGAKNSKPNIRQEILSEKLRNHMPYDDAQRLIYLVEMGLSGIRVKRIDNTPFHNVDIDCFKPHTRIAYSDEGHVLCGYGQMTGSEPGLIAKEIEKRYQKEIAEKEDIALHNIYSRLDEEGKQKQLLCSKLMTLATDQTKDDQEKNVYCMGKKGYNINLALAVQGQRIDLEIPMDNVRNSTIGNPTGEIYTISLMVQENHYH